MAVRKNYLLGLLTVILAFNYVDRYALGLLLQDVKVDLALSDTQLGLLTGIAFAFFYATLGIPIARWADRGNRITIISVTAALWSVAVALCGAATSFMQLMLIRMGVAVGEAGCYPPALSLISDHFTRSERPRAVSRYMLGIPLALLIGYFVAGWLNEFYGWRATFVILGLPGLILAALALFTLKEPRRIKGSAASLAMPAVQPGIMEVFARLWSSAAFRHLLFCFSVWGFFGYGIMQWQPAFFVRSHGLQSGELGTWFALVYGLGGFLGTWAGGELAARYAANDERLQLRVIAIAYVALAILTAGAYWVSNYYLAFVLLGISALVGAATNGPFFAATQTLVPERMRAMSIALLYFFCNLIGMGLGPLAVGALSDMLQPSLGVESLRYALLILCPGFFWCAWHIWQAGETVAEDLAAAHAEST